MPLYAFGDNSFLNAVPSSAELHLLAPTLVPAVTSLSAASWSQALVHPASGDSIIRGLPLGEADLTSAVAWLGQDSFVASLTKDGQIKTLDGCLSESRFTLVAMNGRGELLGVSADPSSTIVFFPSLSSIFSSRPASTLLHSPLPTLSPILSIVAGAAHFLLLTPTSVLSYGDNRFTQCGVPSSTSFQSFSSTLFHIDFFDGLQPKDIAAGAFHSTVVTADGSLYVFGSDSEGQCGGGGGGEPSLITLGEEGHAEDEPELIAVGCGSGHTVVSTTQGVWVAGLNNAGQLGLGDVESQRTFVRNDELSSKGVVTKVVCSRWTTFTEVPG